MKRFLQHVMDYFKPVPQKELVYKESHDLVRYLGENYSVEEQTYIVNRMRDNLILERNNEILQTEEYLLRLKATLEDLKQPDNEK